MFIFHPMTQAYCPHWLVDITANRLRGHVGDCVDKYKDASYKHIIQSAKGQRGNPSLFLVSGRHAQPYGQVGVFAGT